MTRTQLFKFIQLNKFKVHPNKHFSCIKSFEPQLLISIHSLQPHDPWVRASKPWLESSSLHTTPTHTVEFWFFLQKADWEEGEGGSPSFGRLGPKSAWCSETQISKLNSTRSDFQPFENISITYMLIVQLGIESLVFIVDRLLSYTFKLNVSVFISHLY